MEEFLYAYPEMILGIAAGLFVARRGWPLGWLTLVGAVLFAGLALREITALPACTGECEPITNTVAGLIAFADAGAWVFGVAIGAALTRSSGLDGAPPLSRARTGPRGVTRRAG